MTQLLDFLRSEGMLREHLKAEQKRKFWAIVDTTVVLALITTAVLVATLVYRVRSDIEIGLGVPEEVTFAYLLNIHEKPNEHKEIRGTSPTD